MDPCLTFSVAAFAIILIVVIGKSMALNAAKKAYLEHLEKL